MCQTLFYIPHQLGGVPVFGVGWLLLLGGVCGLAWIAWSVKTSGWSQVGELILFLLVTGGAIVFLLPRLEARAPSGMILGLPIRGYGSLMLCGILAGWWLTARRGAPRGLTADMIASLAWRVVIIGIVGARLLFVIEYWPDFRRPTWSETLWETVQFTEGGLIVYGSLIGGFLAYVWFAVTRGIPMLPLGDILAPGVVLGMAIGRIGCLMNGCCYGGECREGLWCLQFPRYNSVAQQVLSPPYSQQLVTGRLHGFELSANHGGQPVVKSVDPGSQAERNGLTAGVRIAALNGVPTESLATAKAVLARAGPETSVELADGQQLKWSIGSLPPHSRPVHPSQIYGAISGVLICLVLLASEPFLSCPGSVLALLFTLYAPVRFLEEAIRNDEPAQWGTGLTLSQLVSLGVLAATAVLWICIWLRPPNTAGRQPK